MAAEFGGGDVRRRFLPAGVEAPRSKRKPKADLLREHVARAKADTAKVVGNGDDNEGVVTIVDGTWRTLGEVPPHCIPKLAMAERLADEMGNIVDWWGLATEVAYETGACYGELIHLRPEHIHVAECIIEINGSFGENTRGQIIAKKPKNGRDRVIAFPDRLQDALARRMEDVERDHQATYTKSGSSKNPLRLMFPAREGGVSYVKDGSRFAHGRDRGLRWGDGYGTERRARTTC